MSNLPLTEGVRVTAYGINASGNSRGTAVTASGTANTKGSFTTIAASTTYDIHGFWVRTFNNDDGKVIFDIAIGPAASEVVIFPDFYIQDNQAVSVFVPLSIPAGTRISARTQCSTSAVETDFAIYGISGSGKRNYGGWRCQQGGADNANTKMTQIDPGGVANTLGAWTQLLASTNNTGKYLMINLQGEPSDTVRCRDLVNIGIGAAASETAFISNLIATGRDYLYYGVTNSTIGFDIDLPAGTRISAQAQSETTQTPARYAFAQVYVFG